MNQIVKLKLKEIHNTLTKMLKNDYGNAKMNEIIKGLNDLFRYAKDTNFFGYPINGIEDMYNNLQNNPHNMDPKKFLNNLTLTIQKTADATDIALSNDTTIEKSKKFLNDYTDCAQKLLPLLSNRLKELEYVSSGDSSNIKDFGFFKQVKLTIQRLIVKFLGIDATDNNPSTHEKNVLNIMSLGLIIGATTLVFCTLFLASEFEYTKMFNRLQEYLKSMISNLMNGNFLASFKNMFQVVFLPIISSLELIADNIYSSFFFFFGLVMTVLSGTCIYTMLEIGAFTVMTQK